MNKKIKYNINTFWLCAMLVFIAILFLYLFTDYKIWDMQYRNAGHIGGDAELLGEFTSGKSIYDETVQEKIRELGEYYSAGEAARDNIGIYILVIVITGLLVYGIVRIRRKKYNPDQFNRLMSSTLVTGFSHELKTPLAVIRTLTENWDYIDEADRKKYTERVTEEVQHVDRLVHRLDDLSKLSSGVIKLNKEDVNLHTLAEEVYKQQKYMIEDRQLEFSIHADEPEKCIVKGDRELLRLAVANFISNAVKYSEHKVKAELVSGKNVLFRITNDGNVLDKEEAAKVWELFYKKDEARTERLSSSGVGLTITRSILKAHKAHFGCTPGNGETIFWFEMRSIS